MENKPELFQRDVALFVALGEIGVTEIAGAVHNSRIIEYHSTTLLRSTADEVPWCAAFVNWCVIQAALRLNTEAAIEKLAPHFKTDVIEKLTQSAFASPDSFNDIHMKSRPILMPLFSASARSFLRFGKTSNGEVGDIVVMKRGKSGLQGHVGFLAAPKKGEIVRVLGGNQGNKVCEQDYPIESVISFRSY